MIYTITLNPALDYIVHVEDLVVGGINCIQTEELKAGGKGINVSMMLHTLGVENSAIALAAGETGAFLERVVKACGVNTDFIHLDSGYTRINVKITAKESTAINGIGPIIDESVICEIKNKLGTLTSNDLVVLAGSLPATAQQSLYIDIIRSLQAFDTDIIIDTVGRLLKDLLPFRPLLVKPNTDELGEYFGKSIGGTEDIIRHAKLLQSAGARNVLISRGNEGSILISEDQKVFIGNCPGGAVVNTVGCGDSMVAGFIAGYARNKDVLEAYTLSIAASSSKAVCTTKVTPQFVQEMEKQVMITRVDTK
jgi:1-phosphofructokinase